MRLARIYGTRWWLLDAHDTSMEPAILHTSHVLGRLTRGGVSWLLYGFSLPSPLPGILVTMDYALDSALHDGSGQLAPGNRADEALGA
jgi:hypothetical protein